ncbi:3-phosphoshikimate 1-carboxyvinyltransferase [Pseudoalteromonas mariniglutinosa]|uniref:3-phosphoshikimate 1-carboxyvinyltransferase n=1 Tax=Pseudoalteromonas mariniglutinosa TaxID=206042 RepID=UPI00384FDA3B
MNLREDPAICSLLQRMPKNIQDTFSDEQLIHLKVAIGARQWGKHKVDCRCVFKAFKYRYYFVFLAGRNRRKLSEKEQQIALFGYAVFLGFLIITGAILFLLLVYIIKSAFGIDVFPSFSFGFWGWLKDFFN